MSHPIRLVIASRNDGKVTEIRNLLADAPVEILSLQDFPDCPESKEPYDTYLENARDKARLVAEHCGVWALADDSGLEVDALSGRPGVFSARYAGNDVTYEDNYRKVLTELSGVPDIDRGARFYCCMVLRNPTGSEFHCGGKLEGRIAMQAFGDQGFGYDPIFYLPEIKKTLAQLDLQEKNAISHRTQALKAMVGLIKRELL